MRCISYFAILISLIGGGLNCRSAFAHPHVFINAKLTLNIDSSNKLVSTNQEWLFDPVFSAGVLVDFAKTTRGHLSDTELKKLTETIETSVADFDFFQYLYEDGHALKLARPHNFQVHLDKLLRINVENRPMNDVIFERGHNYVFYLSDPTFYVDIEFKKDSDVTINGLPNFCQFHIKRPNPDKILSQDLSSLSEDFFADPKNASYLSSQLAIRVEISC